MYDLTDSINLCKHIACTVLTLDSCCFFVPLKEKNGKDLLTQSNNAIEYFCLAYFSDLKYISYLEIFGDLVSKD